MAETKDPAGSNTPPVAPSPGGKSARERGGWLAKIAPGIRNLVTKRDTPENLWVKCPDTGEMIYRPDLEAALWVTPAGRHMRIGPALRFAFTFDEGQHEELPAPTAPDCGSQGSGGAMGCAHAGAPLGATATPYGALSSAAVPTPFT